MLQTLTRSVVVLALIFGLGGVSFFLISTVLAEKEAGDTGPTYAERVETIFVEQGLPPSSGGQSGGHGDDS